MLDCPVPGCNLPPDHRGAHQNQPDPNAGREICGIAVTIMDDPNYPQGRMDNCVLHVGHTGDHSAVPVENSQIINPAPERPAETPKTPELPNAQPTEQQVAPAVEPEPIVELEYDEDAGDPEKQWGRPSKFKEEYTEKMLQFFRKDPVEKIIQKTSGSNGKGGEWSKEEIRYEALTFPTLELFADSIGVHSETLLYWSGRYPSNFHDEARAGQLRHPDFSAAYARIKELQKGWLLQHSLTGKLNSNFAQFFAINNLGMVSKSVVEENTTVKHEYEDMSDEQLDAEIKKRENRTA